MQDLLLRLLLRKRRGSQSQILLVSKRLRKGNGDLGLDPGGVDQVLDDLDREDQDREDQDLTVIGPEAAHVLRARGEVVAGGEEGVRPGAARAVRALEPVVEQPLQVQLEEGEIVRLTWCGMVSTGFRKALLRQRLLRKLNRLVHLVQGLWQSVIQLLVFPLHRKR